MKILIVDDIDENLYLLKTMLESQNHDTIEAKNGKIALSKLKTEQFDLIISDILMPTMDGFQFCSECKKDHQLKQIPFVFYTATYTEEKDEEFALKLGADRFLRKPMDPADFIPEITKVVVETESSSIEIQNKSINEDEELRLYNSTLIRKLEKKAHDLASEIERREKVEQELAEQNRQLLFLNELSHTINEPMPVNTIIKNSMQALEIMMKPDISYFFLREGEKLKLVDAATDDLTEIIDKVPEHRVGECLCGISARQNKAVYSKDINYDPRCTWKECKEAGIKSFAAIPLVHESETLGVLGIASKTIKDFSRQSHFLETFASQITTGLSRSNLFAELRQSEERFRILFENAPFSYQSLDKNGYFIEVNETWCNLLGYTKEEVQGKNFSDFLHPEFKEHFEENFPKFKSFGYILGVEFEMIKKNGSEITVTFDGKIGKNTEGAFQQTHCVLKDITEHKKAEEALYQSEEKFKTLVTNSEEIIYMIDNNGSIILSEGKGLEKLDLKPGEIVGQSVFELYKDYPDILDSINKALKGESVTTEVKIGGNYFRSWYSPHKDNENEIIGLLGLSVNITDQKMAEDALRNSEEKFRALVTNTEEVVYIIDTDGKFLLSEGKGLSKLGLKPGEAVGQSVFEMYKDYPEMIVEMKKAFNGESVNIEVCVEDNHFRTWYTPYVNETGKIIGILGLSINITDQKKAELALRESEEKFRTVLDTTAFPIAVLDKDDDNILFWSSTANKIFGHTPPTSSEWYELAYPDPEYRRKVIERWNHYIEVARESKSYVNTGEHNITCKDGSIRICEIYANFLSNNLIVTFNDITERKKAEEDLINKTRENKLLDEMISNSSQPFAVANLDGKLLRINKAFCELTGYSNEELLTEVTWNETLTPSEWRDKETKMLEKLIDTGEAQRFEKEYIKKDGQRISVELLVNHTVDEHGEIQNIYGFITDITERKVAQMLLQQEKEFTETALNAQSDTFFLLDPSTSKAIRWNKAFSDISGYSNAEIAELPAPQAYYSPEDLEKAGKVIRRVMAGKDDSVEMELICKDGSRVPTEYNASLVKDNYGNPKYIVSIGRDISERKMAEKILRERTEENLLLAEYIENSSQPFAVGSADGMLRRVNEAFCKLTGYNEDELIRNVTWNETLTPPEWREFEAKNLEELISTKSPQRYEKEYFKKDGSRISIEIFVHGLFDKSGNLENYYGFITEITKRKKYEEALRSSEEKLRNLFDTTPFPIGIADLDDSRMHFWSRSALKIFGHNPSTTEEWYQLAYPDPVYRQEVIERWKPYVKIAFESNEPINTGEYNVTCKDGSVRICELYIMILQDNLIVTFNDISERKKVEQKIQESEIRYKSLFNNSPVPLWEEDLTDLKKYLEEIKSNGGQDLRDYFKENPEQLLICAQKVKVIDVNEATLILHEADSKEKLLGNLDKIFTQNSIQVFLEEIIAISEGKTEFSSEGEVKTLDGNRRDVFLRFVVDKNQKDNNRILVSTSDITDQKLVELVVKESANHLQALIEASPIGIAELDKEGKVILWSPGAVEIFGWSEMEVIGKMNPIVPPEKIDEFKILLDRVLKGEKLSQIELKRQRKDGSGIDISLSTAPLYNANGEITGLVGAMTDITKRKIAEEKLRDSEERLNTFFQHSPVGFGIFDREYRYIYVNEELQKMNGPSREEHIGHTIHEVLPQSARILETLFDKIFSTGESFLNQELSGEVPSRPGTISHYIVSYFPMSIKDGKPQYIGAVIVDITVSKLAEESLRLSEERLNAFFKYSPVAFGIWDKSYRYVYVNDELQKANGPSREEHIGKTIYEVVPELASSVEPLFKHIFSTGESMLNMELSGEVPSGSGKIVHAFASYFPMSMAEGKPQYIGGVIVNITDLKNAQNALQESEIRFKSLFENAAVPIWLEDFSEVKKEFDKLKIEGVTDYNEYFNENPQAVSRLAELVNIVDVNQKSVEFYQAGSKENLVKNLHAYFTEQSLNVFKEEIIALANGNTVFEAEIPIQTPDGKFLFLIVSLSVPEAHRDTLNQVLVSFVDITERKKSEAKVLSLLHDQEIILNNVPALIFFKDTKNNILRITKSVADLTGLPKDQIEGKPSSEIYPDLAEQYYADDLKVIKSGIPERGIIEAIDTIDGKKWLLTDKIPYRDTEGNIEGIIVISVDITALKESEKALHDSEIRFRSMIEQSPISMALYDTNGQLTYGNPASRKLLEVSEQELEYLYETYNILEDELLKESGNMKIIEEGFSGKYSEIPPIMRVLKSSPDGSPLIIKWLKSFIYPVNNEVGNIEELVMVHEDITERKNAIEALKESEERFKAIFEQAAVGVAQVDTKTGKFIRINKKYGDIIGYSQDEMENLSFQDIIHPDDLENEQENLRQLRSGIIREFTLEKRYYHKDGSIVWVDISVAPMWKIGKEPDYHIAVVEDITERKIAEENLKRIEWLLNKNVVGSENKGRAAGSDYYPTYGDLLELNTSRTILDSVGKDILYQIAGDYLDLLDSSAAIYERNGDYAFGIFASGWCQHLDQASFNLCGTSNTEAALNSGKWLCHESCWKDAAEVSMETGKPVDIECNGGINLYAIPVVAGGEVVGSINVGHGDPPRDPKKLREIAEKYQVDFDELSNLANSYETRPHYIVELAKKRLQSSAQLIGEIVERRKAEHLLNQLNIELGTKNTELEQLLYATSHDLRSPLVNIHGFNKELKSSLEELDSLLTKSNISNITKEEIDAIIRNDIPEALQYILSSTTKMDSLLYGLLTLSRLGRQKPTSDKVDVNTVLREVINNYEYEIKEKQIQLEITDLPKCRGDSQKLNQMFSNLLENSIKYLDPERDGKITISGEKLKNKIKYIIEDNGIGIPEDHLKKIFDIFYQFDPNKSGIGIGLTIVRQILEQHGGSIEVIPKPDYGTKFILTLPDTKYEFIGENYEKRS